MWTGVSCYPVRFEEEDAHLGAPVLVEACCKHSSLLSQPTRWNTGRRVVCITEEEDFTSPKGKMLALENLKGPADAIWLSCPCIGGSGWARINWHRGEETRKKIREHWELFRRIWSSFSEVAEVALAVGSRVFIEWPRGLTRLSSRSCASTALCLRTRRIHVWPTC